MALNGLFCADAPLRNYSATHSENFTFIWVKWHHPFLLPILQVIQVLLKYLRVFW